MNIILKKLHAENFKIFKNITVDFSMLTKIFAQNYRGKSSLVDLFFWTLFGKSSTGNSEGKQFCPRRYDGTGTPIDHVDVIGEITLDVDGREIIIRKVQSQKWVRKRGSEETTYEGDTNSYTWNEVPVSEAEHKRKVAEIIDEEVFKMITNPHAFVSKKQDDQRKFLVEKVAQITDADVFGLDGGFAELQTMTATKTIEELKAINEKSLGEYKKEQDAIPIRIDEVSKSIIDVDFSDKELQLSALNEQLAEVEGNISDTSKSYEEVNKLKAEIADIKGKMAEIERAEKQKLFEARNAIGTKKQSILVKLMDVDSNIQSAKNGIGVKNKLVQRNTEFLAESRRQYKAVNAEQFDGTDTICPTCKQSLPVEQITALRSKFEVTKQSRLDGIVEQGDLFNASIEKDTTDIADLGKKLTEYESEKAKLEKQLADAKAELEKLPSVIDLSKHNLYPTLENSLINAEMNLQIAIDATADVDTLKQSLLDNKVSIQNQIDAVKTESAKKQQIEDARDRVEELRDELKQTIQKVANCERLQFLLEKFEAKKMDLLSTKINSKFRRVKWSLWHKQKNGGVEPICVCTLNGTPYGENTMSTTERMIAGCDILETLMDIYGVHAPVFFDNAEAYTEENQPKLNTQMIMLFVSEDKELVVKND